MCLYVKIGCEPQIAQEDILCYKVVSPGDGHNYVSLYKRSKQPYNKLVQATYFDWEEWGHKKVSELRLRKSTLGERTMNIQEGFHACCLETGAEEKSRRALFKGFVRKAVIPKGTEYCLGEDGDIVATQMIVFGSDKAYQNYKLKNNK